MPGFNVTSGEEPWPTDGDVSVPRGRSGTTGRNVHDRVRSYILGAAVGAATDGGFDRMMMSDVAGRAGVAVGTLYEHYPSKVHLLLGALQAELKFFQSEICGTVQTIADPGARLRYVVD